VLDPRVLTARLEESTGSSMYISRHTVHLKTTVDSCAWMVDARDATCSTVLFGLRQTIKDATLFEEGCFECVLVGRKQIPLLWYANF
jgi:hypothetical protein